MMHLTDAMSSNMFAHVERPEPSQGGVVLKV